MGDLLTLIAIVIAVFLLKMILVMFGWNLFMCSLFGMQSLSLSQAVGFTLLASCFAGSSITKK